ncbi:unnamed protein product [Diamesa tonsa]
MMKFICILIVLISLTQEGSTYDVIDGLFQNIGTYNFPGTKKSTTYYLSRQMRVNWIEANLLCRRYEMEMLSLETEGEYNNFQTIFNTNLNSFDEFVNVAAVELEPFSGGPNAPWMWESGNLVETQNKWVPNKPDNVGEEHCLCLAKQFDAFYYDDMPCRSNYYIVKFVCQKTITNKGVKTF